VQKFSDIQKRATIISKIIGLFKQTDFLYVSDISGTLLIAPSVTRKLCDDLVLSGMLYLSDKRTSDVGYTKTDKVHCSFENIYDLFANEDNYDLIINEANQFTCIMSSCGFCFDVCHKVPCNGTEEERTRCYRWNK
jgi:hypothetical protein